MSDPNPDARRSRGLLRLDLLGVIVLVIALAVFVHRDLDRSPGGWGTNPPKGSTAEVFEGVYASKVWGDNAQGRGHSGSGSTMEATWLYRAFLQNFMKEHDIQSVVDAGCGDWEFSSAIDWTGIDYKGYDIVEQVIEENRKKYPAPNLKFFVGDIVKDELPEADLLISKHVMQHLSNADVQAFLKQLPRFKYALLINGVDPDTLSAENRDIEAGDYRELDPTRPPFDLPGAKVLVYRDAHHTHQVVLVTRK